MFFFEILEAAGFSALLLYATSLPVTSSSWTLQDSDSENSHNTSFFCFDKFLRAVIHQHAKVYIFELHLRTRRFVRSRISSHPACRNSWRQIHCCKSWFCHSSFFFLLFLHPFRHRLDQLVRLKTLSAPKRAEMADVEQMKKMVPLITSFGQHVCALVSMHLIWISGSRLILSNIQSRATVWVLDTCLFVGLLPLIFIFITASVSSKTCHRAPNWEDLTLDERDEQRSSAGSSAGIPSMCKPTSREIIKCGQHVPLNLLINCSCQPVGNIVFRANFSRPYFLFRDRVVQVSVLDSDVVHSSTSRTHCICLGDWWVWFENVVGNFVILTKNFLNLCCFHQRWYHSVVFSFSRAQTHTSFCSTRRSDRASSVPEHDSVCALSCFHTTSQVTVARGCELIVPSFAGCRFELPDAGSFVHHVAHDAFQTCPVNVCWTHSSSRLPHRLFEHLVAFLQQSSRPVTRRNSPARQLRELLLGHQVFVCHLEPDVLTGLNFSMSMSSRLWSKCRLDVMSLYQCSLCKEIWQP